MLPPADSSVLEIVHPTVFRAAPSSPLSGEKSAREIFARAAGLSALPAAGSARCFRESALGVLFKEFDKPIKDKYVSYQQRVLPKRLNVFLTCKYMHNGCYNT